QTAIAYDIAPLIETNTTEEGAKDLASSVFFENNTHFDMQDLYADVDAANISELINKKHCLYEALTKYYSDLYTKRIELFDTVVLKGKLLLYSRESINTGGVVSYTNLNVWPLLRYKDINGDIQYPTHHITSIQWNGIRNAFLDRLSSLEED
ncbi:MAG: hypothetical protein K6F79_00005, partial [Saccharofermentans sp.]|nr:hypothetical protein [Saccharofermentans sp.]